MSDAQKVLIVEDDLTVSELVADVLIDAGYRPLAIADHALIAETVERFRPRCVLLDGELTRAGESRSWHDAAAIRRAHPTLPVVLFTGDATVAAEARAARSYRSRAAGFAGIIGKPFVIEDLLATVRAAVDTSSDTDTQVFSVIVHELRQPLAVIRGQVELALRQHGADPEGERLALDRSLTQVRRMDVLIDQLLDHARVAADGFSLEVTLVDLASAVADVIATRQYGAMPRISFVGPSGAVPVYGDPARIVQIVENLLSNALKYSAAGTPIEVSLTTDGVEAEVRVADHGVGVPEEERALLFAPFYRTSRARDVHGTGLGLHISRRLAEHHGGRLWLDQSSSAGSVFAFRIPVARGDPMPARSS
ncbi:MAG TPA: ATP-binding protein [Candidatus Limnocylindria bacterium]|nr:ATP-binding protein [Candidatus Limnocylindria bacterium]